MNALELEPFLKPIDYFVVHAKKHNYLAILEVLSEQQRPCAVGYHRDFGWFVLADYLDTNQVSLVWSERNPDR